MYLERAQPEPGGRPRRVARGAKGLVDEGLACGVGSCTEAAADGPLRGRRLRRTYRDVVGAGHGSIEFYGVPLGLFGGGVAGDGGVATHETTQGTEG